MEFFPKDVLLEIINHSQDICDWINFMLSLKNIYIQIYPKFIFKKFKFMVFSQQTLPLCIKNIKHYYYKTYSSSYITTNEKYILEHCKFNNIYLLKTYGLFFQGLHIGFDRFPEINYLKVIDLINNTVHNNIHNEYIFNNYRSIIKSPHIKYINPSKLLTMTINFIKTQNNVSEQLKSNNLKYARLCYNRLIKNFISHESIFIQGIDLKKPETKSNLCIYCNKNYIESDSHLHQRSFISSGITLEHIKLCL